MDRTSKTDSLQRGVVASILAKVVSAFKRPLPRSSARTAGLILVSGGLLGVATAAVVTVSGPAYRGAAIAVALVSVSALLLGFLLHRGTTSGDADATNRRRIRGVVGGSPRPRTVYQRGAALFLSIAVACLAAVVFDLGYDEYFVAFAGSAGIMAGLTYVLSADAVVRADVVDAVYGSLTAIEGLAETTERTRTYRRGEAGEVQLVVRTDSDEPRFVRPTGVALLEAIDVRPPAETDVESVTRWQLEVLADELGLLDRAVVETIGDHSVSVAVAGSPFGSVSRFDHPVASAVATTLVRATDRPVEVWTETTDVIPGDAERITFTWYD